MKDVKIEIHIATAGAKKNVKGLTGDLKDLGGASSQSGKRVSGSFDGIGKSVAGSVAKFGLYTAAAGTVVAAGRRMISQGKEYESALADLEAITGITGAALEDLSGNALDLSVKYGESAANIIEANKLVASQLAEKIDFGTDDGLRQLQDVSEQAIVLQKAAGVDLSTAVKTLTTAVNQFNLDASETPRIINSIAAGSKYGAAEVAAQADAYKEAGSVAASANLQFEDLNGAVQVLAANAITGSQAGTQIRNILLTMANSAKLAENGVEGVNLKSEGLSASLTKLNPLLEDSAALEKLFGRESITAAQILIKNADAVEEMTRKVTDSNVAQEQLAVKMDTAEVAQARFAAAIDSQLIPAFLESGGVMVQSLNTLTEWVQQTGFAISVINDFFDAHSELRDQIADNATQFGLFRQKIQELREEYADLASEEGISVEKQEEIRAAYDATTEAVEGRIAAIEDTNYGIKKNRAEVKAQIEQLEKANAIDGAIMARRFGAGLLELRNEFERLDLSVTANEAQLEEYYKVLAEGGSSFEDFVASIQSLNEETEETEEGAKNLGEQYTDNKVLIDELLNQSEALTSEQFAQLSSLILQNRAIEKQIELRRQAADPDLLGDVDLPDVNVEAELEALNNDLTRQLHDEEMQMYDEKMEAMDEVTAKSKAQSSAEQEAWNATASAIGQAAAQQILYADSVREAGKGIIKAIIAELAARAMLAAFNPPTPASLLLAPILAAAITRVATSAIPGFRTGVDNFEGGLAKVHKGEVITNLPAGSNVITNRNVQAMERMSRQQSFVPDVGRSGGVVVQPADNSDILKAIEAQTSAMESMDRRIEFNISEFKRMEARWTKKEEGLG